MTRKVLEYVVKAESERSEGGSKAVESGAAAVVVRAIMSINHRLAIASVSTGTRQHRVLTLAVRPNSSRYRR